MRWLTIAWLRLRSLLFGARLDDELDEELQYHVQRQIEHDAAAGRDPAAARTAALGAIGGLTQAREECRDMRGLTLIEHALQDARYALRQCRKSPVFAVTAVALMALGLWASVTIFTFVNRALIEPLPYLNPSQLVAVFGTTPQLPRSNLSYPDYIDIKAHNSAFASLSALQRAGASLTTAAGAERIQSARVSDDFFRTLGVAPALGRDFRGGEDLPEAAATAILSHAAWMARFGGAPDVLGGAITLNGEPHVVIGVLPAAFRFAPLEPVEVWRTLRQTSGCDRRRGCHNLTAVARLKDGVAFETAAAGVTELARQLEQQYPDSNRDQGVGLVPLTTALLADSAQTLRVLLAGAVLLLLIAGVNVASLLLVRSEGRRREFAVRTALGASSSRVLRQFVIEGLLLVGAATAIALAAAAPTTALIVSLLPATAIARLPFLEDARPDATVYAFAAMTAVLFAMLFAVLPLLQLPRRNAGTAGENSRGSSGRTWQRVGSRLVVLELTLAMVLLAGAGLLAKSVYRLLGTELGLQPERLATLPVALPGTKYDKPEKMVAFARESLERARALPGVHAAAISSTVPLLGGNTMWIRVAGRPYNGEHNEVHYREVSAGYFETLGARLFRGRDFADHEDASKPPVVIVNQALVRTYFQNEDPLGKQLLYGASDSSPAMEIVGIVNDIKESPVDKDTPPTIYVAFAQDPTTGFALVVRTAQAEQAILPALAAEIRRMDPDVVTFGGRSMQEIIDQSPAAYTRRAAAWLTGGFALSAWILAVVGLYGVIAYSVGQRRREIGVRMALGAERTMVMRLVLGEAGRLAIVGVAAGLVAAIGAGLSMRTLLFEVQPWDAATLASAAGGLALSALVASYIPARRAASVSPTEALRAE